MGVEEGQLSRILHWKRAQCESTNCQSIHRKSVEFNPCHPCRVPLDHTSSNGVHTRNTWINFTSMNTLDATSITESIGHGNMRHSIRHSSLFGISYNILATAGPQASHLRSHIGTSTPFQGFVQFVELVKQNCFKQTLSDNEMTFVVTFKVCTGFSRQEAPVGL